MSKDERICHKCGGLCSQDLVCDCQCHWREFCRSGWTNDQCSFKRGHDGLHSNENRKRRRVEF
jgi:hypothetical protein